MRVHTRPHVEAHVTSILSSFKVYFAAEDRKKLKKGGEGRDVP